MPPQVSIIVPAFNAGRFLEECLDSIRSQTFGDFECIVVNDGSIDSTGSIAEAFGRKDSRFKTITTPNSGVSAARNTGIDLAVGEYLVFADADDLLHPEALAGMIDGIQKFRADICITAFKKFKTDKNSPSVRFPKSLRTDVEIYNYREAMKAALYQKRLFNSPWGLIIKRSLLGSDIRFREGTRYEDLDAFYRFFEKAEKIVYIPFPYYYYRDNEESFLHSWSPERLDVLDVTDRMLSFFKDSYPELVPAAYDRRYSAHFNMLLLILKNGENQSDFLARCYDVIKQGRTKTLSNPSVRIKNKIGALLSFGGIGTLRLLSKLI